MSIKNLDNESKKTDVVNVQARLSGEWLQMFEQLQADISKGVLLISSRDVVVFLLDFYNRNKQITNGEQVSN